MKRNEAECMQAQFMGELALRENRLGGKSKVKSRLQLLASATHAGNLVVARLSFLFRLSIYSLLFWKILNYSNS